MERLTERFSNGQAAVLGCGNNCKYDFKYCKTYNENCPTITRIYEKLAHYEDIEERGKILILPCNYGDYVWFIKSNFSYAEEPIKARISYIAIRENGDFFFRTNVCGSGIDRTFSSSNIGKTVFLTEQEAKEALEGMKE